MITDEFILNKISKEEAGELRLLIRSTFPTGLKGVEATEKMIKEWKGSKDDRWIERTKKLRRIHNLYKKITSNENDYMLHWHISWEEQRNIHKEYQHNKPPERKDNKTYLNIGNGCSNANKVRYPKKVRKTAWKRFYKLFPNLAPKEKLNDNLTII